ncbi:MAG TPA: hypothetical protein VF533_03420 [Solirubrobacteraceae bacterium]
MNEAGVAAATSLAVGVFTIRYTEYAYWRGWAQATILGAVALALVYLLGGLVGFLIVHGALGGAQTGPAAAAGEGLLGHVMLRAQLGRLSPSDEDNGPTLLTLINGWILDALAARAASGVLRWVRGLPDDRLVGLTFDLFWQHLETPDEPLRARILELLRAAAHDLEHGTDRERADGRGRLRGFCCKEIESQQIPKGDLT